MLLTPLSFTLAYIGPGAGLGLIGALVSLLASVGFALAMVVFWPIRNALKRRASSGHDPNAPLDETSPS